MWNPVWLALHRITCVGLVKLIRYALYLPNVLEWEPRLRYPPHLGIRTDEPGFIPLKR